MSQDAQQTPHRVVVIGSGFGGINVVQSLEKAPVQITLIAKTTHHLFQPLLYQVATGILSEGEIAPPTRLILAKQKNAKVLLGDVEQIDTASKTVVSRIAGSRRRPATVVTTPYDTLVIAAGADQSYFGNDHFSEFAPGMKTIDDALELRGRIVGAFELAEATNDPVEQERALTFVVVGAGPTGVEVAGQIAELAHRTFKGAFKNIDARQARIILLDGAPAVLPPMGKKLGEKAQKHLEKIGVEVRLDAIVVDVDQDGVTYKDKAGALHTIATKCKVWSAGVAASPLGKQLAAQTGVELDRAGRVVVDKDLSVPGHPDIFVVGDMASVPGVPGMAQGAIQGGKHAAKMIKGDFKGEPRKPFKYLDKGSMSTISRFSAVAKVWKFEFSGFIAWVLWLFIHLYYLVGFKNRVTTIFSWLGAFITPGRAQLTITHQQIQARIALLERNAILREQAEAAARGAEENSAAPAAEAAAPKAATN
ncbi:NAD(P)/FAD-dependent oxidoreductase [Segniliparus rugosus]|uniref:NADH:ubiquinone reductase (non-electrogenic) n=1 Tax=Segniliparus rugosus (strain ATCC BAA-974 / DSM 45345 / CCUG 50838 / CIP 108380 / JCM 13579 / CDC 945) TaxID=679197 RepID=E5XNW4_SEGRC|nr:NAD(P)/FAD-dependent oxidoreductase [Segniliparus rugosus]EFV13959.1 hypothetical protein HMPREF9336_01185 [Segniliparus rugosus ATCC BAA-974]